MTQMVRYYDLRGSQRAVNRGIVVAFGDWPDRVKAHRGWRKKLLICQRATTPEEDEFLKNCMRHQAWIYPSVEALLVDEKLVCAVAVFERIAAALTDLFDDC